MRLVFAGTPPAAVPSLRTLVESSHDVVAVITRPDAPAGRGRRTVRSPVGDFAAEQGIPLLQPTRLADDDFLRELTALEPDCCPVVAFGGLVPTTALSIPTRGWVNLHFSLLPAWRGAAPVQYAILHGDEITGASTFLLDEGLDTGPLFGAVTEEIRPQDTSGTLLDRLSHSGAALLLRTVDGIAAAELGTVPQPPDGVSLAPKLTVDDARVDWHGPALHIDRLLRACTPAPGGWTTYRGERLKLLPAVPETGETTLAPAVLSVTKSTVLVGTGSCAVRLTEVQPHGKRVMPAADWARGVRAVTGELLE